MSPERTQAYKRVMRTLSDLGPTKLLAGEQDRIRTAADTLIFSASGGEQTVDDALADIDELCRDLVASGRWEPVTAARLARDLRDCSPQGGADEALRAA
jgi:hypothetical protein